MARFEVVDKISNDFVKATIKMEKVKTDNTVFRLHYKWSVWLVIIYSLGYMYVLMTNPINCVGNNSVVKAKGKYAVRAFREAINDYCWVHGTYTVTNLDPALEIYPGIGASRSQDTRRYHHYYKWMYFYLSVMMILLYVPRHFWRSVEHAKMSVLSKKLQRVVLSRDVGIQKEKDSLADYLHCNVGYHRKYAFGFVFAEFLNVMVSLTLLIIWDLITEHEFSMHGAADFSVMKTPPSLRTDRLSKVFPLLGKCLYRDYGPGGNIQPHDFVCILPLNLINERAAVFFWYWFMMLLALGIGALIFRIALIGSESLRLNLLSGLTPLILREDLKIVMKACSYSDWFVIYQLGSSVDPVLFREIMEKLIRKFRGSEFLE